jgi:hypothetical protein
MHVPPQAACPLGQAHAPPVQDAPAIVHARAQAPQLFMSDDTSRQAPAQTSSPTPVQPHVPPWQLVPGTVHALPHAPQLLTSDVTSTHVPEQSSFPPGQEVHVPPRQLVPGTVHALPQAPQLLTSDVTSTHVPEQFFWRPGQTHTPPWHGSPAAQAWPQPPQLAESVWVSTHSLLHGVSLALAQAHWLALQVAPAPGHTIPHAPQLSGSFDRSVHTPLHADVPDAHAHTPPGHAGPVSLLGATQNGPWPPADLQTWPSVQSESVVHGHGPSCDVSARQPVSETSANAPSCPFKTSPAGQIPGDRP